MNPLILTGTIADPPPILHFISTVLFDRDIFLDVAAVCGGTIISLDFNFQNTDRFNRSIRSTVIFSFFLFFSFSFLAASSTFISRDIRKRLTRDTVCIYIVPNDAY